jgi:hypothetical protein
VSRERALVIAPVRSLASVRTLLGVRVRSLASVRTLALAALCGPLVAACAPASSPDAPPIASLHAHRCGKCHAPPEPGTHTRAQLEDAFGRHKSRARLTPEEWSAMTDYLAVHDGAMTRQKD